MQIISFSKQLNFIVIITTNLSGEIKVKTDECVFFIFSNKNRIVKDLSTPDLEDF